MKKNVAGQIVGGQLCSATDGSDFTGSVTCYVTGNGGTQAAGSVGSGACTHEGNGFHTYTPSQAESNYDHVAFTFKASGAVTATVQVYPSFPQTGDNFALIGTTGSGLTSLASAANLATVAGYIDTEVAAIKAKTDNLPADPADASDVAAAFTALSAKVDTIDDLLDTEVAAIKSDTAAILVDTAEIGAAGAGLTAIPWGSGWYSAAAAAVWNAATASYGTAGSYGLHIETNLDVAVSSVSGGGGGGVADWTSDEKTAIRSILGIPASGTTPDDPTAGILDTIRDAVLVVDDFLDTEIGAIKAKTDNLPSDPADASDIATAFTALSAKVDVIDDFLDTEVAAIKAKTDLIPSDPADASDIAASFATVNSKIDAVDDLIDTEIAAIKAETASIQADTNDIQSRLPAALTGAGNMKADSLAISGSTAAADNLEGHALRTVPVTFTGGTTTTAVLANVDGAAASSTDDVYNGRILVFSGPAGLKDQACSITDYVGATKTATITAVTTAVSASAAAVMA